MSYREPLPHDLDELLPLRSLIDAVLENAVRRHVGQIVTHYNQGVISRTIHKSVLCGADCFGGREHDAWSDCGTKVSPSEVSNDQAGPRRIPARSACSGGAWVSQTVPSKNATWHWR